MSRIDVKNQIAFPLLAAALFALAMYLVYALGPARQAPPRQAEPPVTATATPAPTATPSPVVTPTPGVQKPLVYNWVTELADPATWLLLLQIALSVCLVVVVVRLLGAVAFFLFRRRKGYEAPSLMQNIFSLVAYFTAFVLLVNLFFPNVSFGALLSGSALLGVILGLALQDTLGNLFSGISLHADKPFQVGDVISVGKWTGTVESVTWRAVKIKTFQNHFILVSNSSIAKEHIEVCPRGNANARIVFFSALYSDSPVKVIHVVREAVRETDNVLRYMTPVVRIRDLGADGVDYECKYWLSDYARFNDTDALVRQKIWYAYRRNGLSFAYPTRTVYMQPPEMDGAGAGDGLADLLSNVEIFSPLTQEELGALAVSARGHVFAPGETIIRKGDPASSMFVVHRGSVDVRVEANGQMKTINTLRDGAFFGEMGLFTGEPRTAHVVAAEETEVIEIGHAAMKELLLTNPDLVESLSQTILERRKMLAAKTHPPTRVEEEEVKGLLPKIRRFFGLS